MGYRLRMSGEIRDWVADLRDSDPPAAVQVGQALIALMGEGPSLGPPLVISLADPPGSADLPEALDESYEDRLEQLDTLRRHYADAATLVKDIERQVADLETRQAQLGDQRWRALQEGKPEAAVEAVDELAKAQEQLAELRRLLPGMIDAQRQLNEKSQRNQAWVNAFRTRKEALKANYVAAQAEREIRETVINWGENLDAARQGSQSSESEAEAKLREITADIERELRPPISVAGLKELRPGAPGDSDIRILFAVEPAGTALLIAVLEGRAAVREQRSKAVELSADVLQRARAGQAPEATEHAFDDAPSFLDEFFPGSAVEVEAGAAALVAKNRARTLAVQRTRLGLTQAQVAERMGVRQERVSAIERAEPGATEVRTLAGYVEALGGRLEIIADFGEERVVLR